MVVLPNGVVFSLLCLCYSIDFSLFLDKAVVSNDARQCITQSENMIDVGQPLQLAILKFETTLTHSPLSSPKMPSLRFVFPLFCLFALFNRGSHKERVIVTHPSKMITALKLLMTLFMPLIPLPHCMSIVKWDSDSVMRKLTMALLLSDA